MPPPSALFEGITLDMQRFRGGLVFKAHRLCVSLNTRLEINKEGETVVLRPPPSALFEGITLDTWRAIHVWGSGLRLQGVGFEDEGVWFRIWKLGFDLRV